MRWITQSWGCKATENNIKCVNCEEPVYDVDAIYIVPPDAGVLTDQDSGDEDGGGSIDNLPGAQLHHLMQVS
ncbi:hypothetical protein QE152_g22030 [Popillia japonica]|uniref:Uncharacterized protein n=1 Tax=Popillia japonica TaxID=7064 RepID=A0AAW1KLL8_POPJA